MPTPPDFTTGAVLTAAQMRTIGMHLINTTSISNGATTASISNVFSADYDRYQIVFYLAGSSAGNFAHFRLRNSGGDLTSANYYRTGTYSAFGGAWAAYNAGATTSFQVVGEWGGSIASTCIMDIFNPFLTTRTGWNCNTNNVGGGAGYFQMGLADNTTSYTGFTVYPNAGTFLTGSYVKVYGYRNSL